MNPASLCCSTLAHVKAMLYCTRATLEQGGRLNSEPMRPITSLLFVGFTPHYSSWVLPGQLPACRGNCPGNFLYLFP